MATVRHHTRINRPADEVWKVVADFGAISTWFPPIAESSAEGGTRHCTLVDGAQLTEELVTNDPALQRLQYRIVSAPFDPSFHLATIDVFDLDGGAFVVYSTDVTPDEHAGFIDEALETGLAGLKEHLER